MNKSSFSDPLRLLLSSFMHRAVDFSINERAELLDQINRAKLPDGTMWVSQSGRDCDGSAYQWSAYKIPATLMAYYKETHQIGDSADGPFHLNIHNKNNLPKSWSRDLAMEAYEDGHPHLWRYEL